MCVCVCVSVFYLLMCHVVSGADEYLNRTCHQMTISIHRKEDNYYFLALLSSVLRAEFDSSTEY